MPSRVRWVEGGVRGGRRTGGGTDGRGEVGGRGLRSACLPRSDGRSADRSGGRECDGRDGRAMQKQILITAPVSRSGAARGWCDDDGGRRNTRSPLRMTSGARVGGWPGPVGLPSPDADAGSSGTAGRGRVGRNHRPGMCPGPAPHPQRERVTCTPEGRPPHRGSQPTLRRRSEEIRRRPGRPPRAACAGKGGTCRS